MPARMNTIALISLLFLIATPSSSPAQQTHDWPQWRGPKRDGVWREQGIVTELPDVIPAKWRTPIGAGYCGPTVADGRVYVMDRLADEKEVERVHCLDANNGKVLWTHTYDAPYRISYKAGPRCSVLVANGRAYALGSMGHLHCLDAKTGKVHWRHDLLEEYEIRMPIWGIAASPVLEEDVLIVPVSGRKGACLVGFDATSGKERWSALEDRGNYSAPIVIDQAGKRVLVCWTGDRVVGVGPKTGKLHWAVPFKPKNMPLGVASPVLEGDLLFLSGFYDGSLLLRVHDDALAVTEVWRRRGQNERRTDALHTIIATPLVKDGHAYGTCSYGEFRCIDLKDGARVWEDRTAVPRARWATIHLVQNGDRTWMFNERGELIIGKLSPKGFVELDRGKLIEPTREQLNRRGGVCWTHPAYAGRHVFIRNDEEIICADLSARK